MRTSQYLTVRSIKLKNLFDLSYSPDLWLACFAPGLVRDMSYLKQNKNCLFLKIEKKKKKKKKCFVDITTDLLVANYFVGNLK